jgi:hypothetical protein
MQTRALGAEPDLRVNCDTESTRPHDRYLPCTDSVHVALSDRAIPYELDRRGAPEETARRTARSRPSRVPDLPAHRRRRYTASWHAINDLGIRRPNPQPLPPATG